MLPDHPLIWLRRRPLSLDQWTALSRTRGEVRAAERVQPRYALQLRGVAVETLADPDVRVARTAIVVLAAVGTADEVAPLRRCAAASPALEADARRAVLKIENREARGQEPLGDLNISTTRERIGRTVLGVMGLLSIPAGILMILKGFDADLAPFAPMIMGLGTISFGTLMLRGAWTGHLPGSTRK